MAPQTSTATKSSETDRDSNRNRNGNSSRRKWQSRAVMRLIEAGCAAECPHCEERVKFRARQRDQQVICNIYDKGVWQRVEQYHLECYSAADSPYGEPT